MKIAIIDIGKSHHEYLLTQARVFENDTVDYFVSDFLKSCVDSSINMNPNHNWYPMMNPKKKISYIYQVINKIKKGEYSYVIINTLQNDWVKYLLLALSLGRKKRCKLVLSVHNINSYFDLPHTRRTRNILKQFIKRMVFKRADAYNVFGENLKEYLRSRLGKNVAQKNITTIPFSCYNETLVTSYKTNEKFKIVVPGTVNYRRRDYTFIERLFEAIKGYQIEIVLLGMPVGEEGQKLVEKLSSHKNFVVYNDFVSPVDFDQQMESADIILSPIELGIYHDGVLEEYGLSKESGVSFASIKYAIPLVIPSNVKKMKELENGTLHYSNIPELVEIITNLLDYGKYTRYKELAKENSLYFESSEIRRRLSEELGLPKES